MIDHVSIAVSDLAASADFYDAVLAPLGLAKLVDRTPATIVLEEPRSNSHRSMACPTALLAPVIAIFILCVRH